jgi:hypothetical protein
VYTNPPRNRKNNGGDVSGKRKSQEARRFRVVRYRPRSRACLPQYLRQLTPQSGRGALPSTTLSQLITARPLWKLLTEAATDEGDGEEAVGTAVRALMGWVLCEAVGRMRGTAKNLAKDLLELPYFSEAGPLAKHIQRLASKQR